MHPLRKPPRTRPARSLVDAASWAGSDGRCRLIVISGVQQGVATTGMLREALQRRGACRHRALIVQSILDAAGGIQSLPERDFRQLCHTRGLPGASRQVAVRGKDKRYYLDVEWEQFKVVVEIHGIPHVAIANWDDDLDRANEVVIGDKRLLIFSSCSVRHRPDRVGDQVRRALATAGWTGKST